MDTPHSTIQFIVYVHTCIQAYLVTLQYLHMYINCTYAVTMYSCNYIYHCMLIIRKVATAEIAYQSFTSMMPLSLGHKIIQ